MHLFFKYQSDNILPVFLDLHHNHLVSQKSELIGRCGPIVGTSNSTDNLEHLMEHYIISFWLALANHVHWYFKFQNQS